MHVGACSVLRVFLRSPIRVGYQGKARSHCCVPDSPRHLARLRDHCRLSGSLRIVMIRLKGKSFPQWTKNCDKAIFFSPPERLSEYGLRSTSHSECGKLICMGCRKSTHKGSWCGSRMAGSFVQTKVRESPEFSFFTGFLPSRHDKATRVVRSAVAAVAYGLFQLSISASRNTDCWKFWPRANGAAKCFWLSSIAPSEKFIRTRSYAGTSKWDHQKSKLCGFLHVMGTALTEWSASLLTFKNQNLRTVATFKNKCSRTDPHFTVASFGTWEIFLAWVLLLFCMFSFPLFYGSHLVSICAESWYRLLLAPLKQWLQQSG